jgi:hypothetical protein
MRSLVENLSIRGHTVNRCKTTYRLYVIVLQPNPRAMAMRKWYMWVKQQILGRLGFSNTRQAANWLHVITFRCL